MAALASLLVKLSHLAVDQAAWLESLDLNPVIVLPGGQGAWVVDLRLAVRGTEAGGGRTPGGRFGRHSFGGGDGRSR